MMMVMMMIDKSEKNEHVHGRNTTATELYCDSATKSLV